MKVHATYIHKENFVLRKGSSGIAKCLMIIIANTSTFAAWIYFQRARDDDESLTRTIIEASRSVTGFAETKAKDECNAR